MPVDCPIIRAGLDHGRQRRRSAPSSPTIGFIGAVSRPSTSGEAAGAASVVGRFILAFVDPFTLPFTEAGCRPISTCASAGAAIDGPAGAVRVGAGRRITGGRAQAVALIRPCAVSTPAGYRS